MITQEQLKAKLKYDSETGVFRWQMGTRLAGSKAGHLDNTGYIRIRVFDKLWQAHVLAWLYVTGSLPSGPLDHVDRVRTNNAFSNLRIASAQTQSHNTGLRVDNKAGVKGVAFDKFTGRWKAHFTADGFTKTIGRFGTLEEATRAREEYAREWHRKQNEVF